MIPKRNKCEYFIDRLFPYSYTSSFLFRVIEYFLSLKKSKNKKKSLKFRTWQRRLDIWLPNSVGSEQRGQEHSKNHFSRNFIFRFNKPWINYQFLQRFSYLSLQQTLNKLSILTKVLIFTIYTFLKLLRYLKRWNIAYRKFFSCLIVDDF